MQRNQEVEQSMFSHENGKIKRDRNSRERERERERERGKERERDIIKIPNYGQESVSELVPRLAGFLRLLQSLILLFDSGRASFLLPGD